MAVQTFGYSLTDALILLSDDCQAAVAPVLSEAELVRLLRVAAVMDDSGNLPDPWFGWLAGATYRKGDRVVSRDVGFVFKATAAGTVGTDEPDWPDTIGDTIGDGTVTWTCEDTAPWTPTYSRRGLDKAAAAGCRLHAAKLGSRPTLSAEGVSLHPEEQRAFWEGRAQVFERTGGMGTASLGGATTPYGGTDDWVAARQYVVIAN